MSDLVLAHLRPLGFKKDCEERFYSLLVLPEHPFAFDLYLYLCLTPRCDTIFFLSLLHSYQLTSEEQLNTSLLNTSGSRKI